MITRTQLATIAGIAVIALTLAASSNATTSMPLEISSAGSVLDRSTIHPGPGNGTAEAVLQGGTFAARGAFGTGGRLTLSVLFSGAASNGDVVHGNAVFVSQRGTFTLKFESLHKPFVEPTFDGSWVLSDATGAYAGLHGTGSVHFEIDSELGAMPIVAATWSGSVHGGAA